MESISKLIFQMNRELFPNISEIMEKSLIFSNYYSTATSTAMVLNDITYGDFYRIENTHFFGQFIETHKDRSSFIDELGLVGYRSLGIHYPAALGNEINPGHMYAQNKDLINYSDYSKALADVKNVIEEARETKNPFLIYFCNEISHLCYADNKKTHIKNPTERWQYGYRMVDKTVGDIFGYLDKENLLHDTIVVLYGDHGDDFYCHDYNGGYAHSIEPYSNIIHTPLFIYDEEKGRGNISDIVCSLDIKQLIYNAIGFDREENPYICEKYHSKRKYVFSRNLFAGQTPQKINGYISNVRKAYAITTEQYSMILTNEGIRLYLNRMDPTCNNNILDYFLLINGKLRHICNIDFLNVHYRAYMGHGTVGEIQRNYARLLKYMRAEIEQLSENTGIQDIIEEKSTEHIFYTKNMRIEFSKLKYKYLKKKAITWKNKMIGDKKQ